ncbi:ABC transporter permease [Methanosphaera sp. ISO3-F5]|uniref:ABC transporter permease n=1 Tax=Methanosphaera sp. ISO3-F5 TaxID=1452353 RepID=UPI002B2607F6|nr:ABC transporter permease [Methanosphaera sp. ISO3-F5]WQH64935.1 ABC transporter permease [Methanosphaera sp. ISO3-F5]
MSILTKTEENKQGFLNLNLRTKTLLVTVIALIILVSVFLSNFLIDHQAVLTSNFYNINQAPSFEHLFGTDWMGRDMFMRTLLGLGISIGVGAFASVISTVVAILLGVFSSVNTLVDEVVTAIIDLFGSIPHILLIILVSLAFGGGYYGVIMAVGLTHWTPLARVLRAEIKKINTSEYIKLSNEFGKSKLWIAKKHIFPLIISQIIVGVILMFPHAIMHEASISFLGFGLPAHEPAIGIILAESMKYLSMGYWWLAFYPGLSLLFLVLLFDLIGENVHRLLDPQSAQE